MRVLVIGSLMLVLISGVLFAQVVPAATPSTLSMRDAALLRAEGDSIKVNGLAVRKSTTIFPEDRIETGPDTAAYIIASGRILTLDRNSIAVFRDGGLVPFQGAAWSGEPTSDSSVEHLLLGSVTSDHCKKKHCLSTCVAHKCNCCVP